MTEPPRPPGAGRGADGEPAATRLDVLVVGYASIDFVWRAASPPAPGRTSILLGPVEPAPRYGGCGPSAAVELARLGRRVEVITWLGDDGYGEAYLRHLRASGVHTAGVQVASGQASPRTMLIYDPAGSATCLYHPSGSAEQTLDSTGLALVRTAAALAITVAPARLTEAVLEARPPGQLLAWNVKADADALPLALRRQLLEFADCVCLNEDELGFLAEGLPEEDGGPLDWIRRRTNAIVVLTSGPRGCVVDWAGGRSAVSAERVEVDDPTGVGDAFFAAYLDAVLAHADPLGAARAASAHAARFLQAIQHGALPGGVAR